MSIFADYRGLPESARGASIALGNFDGLHAGHKAVIAAAREAGEGSFSVATFEPPPHAYFRPLDPPFRIFRPERRNETILNEGAGSISVSAEAEWAMRSACRALGARSALG